MIVAGVLFVFVPVKQADILSTGIVVTIRRRYQDMKKADTLPYPHLYFINGRNECAIYELMIIIVLKVSFTKQFMKNAIYFCVLRGNFNRFFCIFLFRIS